MRYGVKITTSVRSKTFDVVQQIEVHGDASEHDEQ